ncbi:MAG: hypothetical protein FJW27_18755 [Acidimicrobiia bacterium]|nr:hypothetical protein [Acidimicrobiia bacterium]
MSPKEATALRIDVDLLNAMRDVNERKGIPVTTQIEMAVRAWLAIEHGIRLRTERKRGGAHKRA